MKIFGLGTDIVDINRIKKSIKKNALLKQRIFSKKEILFCEKNKNSFSCYSKRFAAKEAFAKALGIGISKGLKFNEIELLNNLHGKPYITLKGKTLNVTKKIVKKKLFKSFVSLSDEKKYSIATVIIVI